MSPRIRAVAAAVAVALACVAAAGAAGSRTYPDAAGDGGDAPDVTAVTVSNDDGGTIAFTIAFANRSTLAGDDAVWIGIDADRNARTGDEDGAEYAVFSVPGEGILGLGRWAGEEYDWDAPRTLVTSRDGTSYRLHRRELGNVSVFDFYVITAAGWQGDDYLHTDLAPEGTAAWTYELKLAPKVRSVAPTFSPAAPTAGRRFAVASARVTLADGRVVRADGVRCTARLAGRALPAAGRCAWNIPETATGKQLVVTVTATYGGTTVTARPVALRVR